MDLKGKLLERLAEELKDAAMGKFYFYYFYFLTFIFKIIFLLGASPIFTWHSSLSSSTAYSKSIGSRTERVSRSGMSFDDGNESVYQSEAGSSDHRFRLLLFSFIIFTYIY